MWREQGGTISTVLTGTIKNVLGGTNGVFYPAFGKV